jgi:hypothetical protein
MSAQQVVPFGKHKGESVEVLLADDGYRDWLMAQPWFRDRYPVIYQTVINYGGEPADTPEHNEMQASFLDDERCLRLARRLWPRRRMDRDAAEALFRRHPVELELARNYAAYLSTTFEDASPAGRRFEDDGWDVTFTVAPAAMSIEVHALPECRCGQGCVEGRWCHPGDEHAQHRAVGFTAQEVQLQAHCWPDCPWHDHRNVVWLLDEPEPPTHSWAGHRAGRWFQPAWPGTARIELKPDLGDDFPAVLRQVLRYPVEYEDRRCVIARRHAFHTVTWAQVQSMFAASGVNVLAEAELNSPTEATEDGGEPL